MIREFLFEAVDAAGAAAKESVVATDVADAKAQLGRMGYRDIKVLTEELNQLPFGDDWDPKMASQRIDAAYDSIGVQVVKMLAQRWFFLLPGAALYAWVSYTGEHSTLAPTLLTAGCLGAVMSVLPGVLYNQALWARTRGHFRLGLKYISLLRFLTPKKGDMAVNFVAEKAKMNAYLGKEREALAEFAQYEGGTNRKAYLVQVSSIHAAAGNFDAAIEVQRLLLKETGSKEVAVDLAWSLMRYTTSYDEARQLIAGIHASDLAELYGHGFRIVQALLEQADGRHAAAIAGLRKEHDAVSRFSVPLTIGMCAELRGYIALSMKALGKRQEADAMWHAVLPLMRIHHNDVLIARYVAFA